MSAASFAVGDRVCEGALSRTERGSQLAEEVRDGGVGEEKERRYGKEGRRRDREERENVNKVRARRGSPKWGNHLAAGLRAPCRRVCHDHGQGFAHEVAEGL